MTRAACLLLLVACGTEPQAQPDEPACVPFEDVFAANIAPIIDDKCSTCHGTTPEFGAPFSLVDGYDDLVAGTEGERKVDRMLGALLSGLMPEKSAEPLSHVELDTLVGWTSCGLAHADASDGLVVNRDVWEAGDTPPSGTEPIELTAVAESVGLDAIDDYRSFPFSNLVATDRFIQRIEPIIDESRVVHHITLTRDDGWPYLYGWAPGTGAIELPDGGMRISPTDRFVLEIHYNNGAGVPDAVDSSGVRLWLGDAVGVEYGLMSPASWEIYVPANGTSTTEHLCTATMDFDILAGMPHMHEVGSSFSHDVIRTDGTVDNLITLSGWSFESQYFYEMPMHVSAGDRFRMQCGYDNPTDEPVTAGLGTADEMCFDFLVVTPAAAGMQCAQ
jgi:hypothetical protein